MMTQWTRWATVVLLAASMAACQSQSGGNASAHREPVMLVKGMQHVGNDANLTEPGAWLFQSEQDLQKHGTAELRNLHVDFSKYSLIVFAAGEQKTSGYWACITGAQTQGNRLFVQVTVNEPSTHQMTAEMITHPVAAAVVSKVDGRYEVIIEPHAVQGMTMPGMMPMLPGPAPMHSGM